LEQLPSFVYAQPTISLVLDLSSRHTLYRPMFTRRHTAHCRARCL